MNSYGLTFWNSKTNDEICVFFEANNYFDAEDIVKPIQLKGYDKGTITYIEDRDKSYFNISLEKLIQHPAYLKEKG